MATMPPMQLVAQDYLWEASNGNPSCGGSILMWTDEARWETFYFSLDASMQGGCQPTGRHQDVRSVTRDHGQVVIEKCTHSWRWGAVVLSSHLKRAILGKEGGSLCVSTKDRARTNVRQIVT